MMQFTRMFGLLALLVLFAIPSTGCDKLKALTKPKKVEIKGPKVVIKISKLSKAVRMRGAHYALIRKALKKAKGFKKAAIDLDKLTITVGHDEDADTDEFVKQLQEYGYRVSLQDE